MRFSTIAGVSTLLLAAAAAGGEDRCRVQGSFGGKPVVLKTCLVAFFGGKSVTIWFTESAVSSEEAGNFQLSSYAKYKDVQNKPRTMLSLGFCVTDKPAPGDVKEVSIEVNHESSPTLHQSWVLDFPADKDVKFVTLSGDPRPGGRLAGKVAGSKKEQNQSFTFDIDFDVQLPQKQAGAGLTCD